MQNNACVHSLLILKQKPKFGSKPMICIWSSESMPMERGGSANLKWLMIVCTIAEAVICNNGAQLNVQIQFSRTIRTSDFGDLQMPKWFMSII